ncbi:hypothetical protein FPZ42_10470 [Mucilaginibacter achroorhodeus]|uniref:Uncharacterized protein n=1 Tax=Mucilaginibacter achroorhodeus TaxID=2599294 RepID=A0A563U3W4_9SPHI|nr:hypothetical protein [Mucilaginibacter achroorhodeus]TWR26046.1 hypothetical protein FPZ42_10470 [Mucilaginibacter achroorhodeus]
MLKIDIPQTGSPAFTAAAFDQFDLPTPPNGTDAEINGDVVLLFEDEEEAVDYLDELEDYSASLDNDADAKPYLNALINTIRNDEFVQAYLR